MICDALMHIYDSTVERNLLIRRINICADRVLPINEAQDKTIVKQYSLFSDIEKEESQYKKNRKDLEKENNLQKAMISIKTALARMRYSRVQAMKKVLLVKCVTNRLEDIENER